MNRKAEQRPILSPDEYSACVRRAAALRRDGATADSCPELARIEGAIARYALIPGKPAHRKGRPPPD